MKKVIIRRSNIQLKCGQAKPGANLSFLKNMMAFCRDFNVKTSDRNGAIINVEIKVYNDNSYDYELKCTPTSLIIKDIINKKDKKIVSDSEIDKIISEATLGAKWIFNTKDREKIKKIVLGTLKSFNVK